MLSRTDKEGAGTSYWEIVDSDGRRIIVGPVAHDAAVAGNPVHIAGVYRATVPAVADGDVVNWLMDAAGRGHALNGALQELEVLASAARTATTDSSDFTNPGARGVILTVNTTAHAATPSITLNIQYKVPNIAATYETLFSAAAAITGSPEVHTYILYPDDVVAADDVVEVGKLNLPRTWRVRMTHGDADSITYSVQGCYLP